jgi:hypothetical protein
MPGEAAIAASARLVGAVPGTKLKRELENDT